MLNTSLSSKIFSRANFPALSLSLLVACLPFGINLAPIIILFVASIFFTQSIEQSIANLKSRPMFLLFSVCYLIYILGLFYTENMSAGLKELEYKLAFLVFPIVIAAMNKLEKKQYQLIIWSFISSIGIAGTISLLVSSYRADFAYLPTYIEFSIFHHPSYLSIYIILAFILLIKGSPLEIRRKRPVLFYTIIVFLVFLNYLLNAKIGIIIMLLLVLIFLFQSFLRYSKVAAVISTLSISIILIIVFLTVPVLKNRFKSISQVTRIEEIPKDATESSAIRILIWQQVAEIFQENPWIGVGTGNGKDELISYYEKNGITHAYEMKLNAHNQYFEWLLSFGIIGLLFWLTVLFLPMQKAFLQGNYIYIYFMLSILILLAVESILEREAGIVFFALFNSLLYFHPPEQKSLKA